ncbi:MAG: signal peptidase I [Cellulophaga sp.]|uniref:signal peptidase I n=1 Tax=Cellulophaga sp. RHA19 TaxID=1798237 RepID=UPI000C2C40A7|nr:signal peptidase I [Cellulophaga sp. RHA19]PKB43735.1 signal peptidase I [Cellulophaga sp. RHA19]
MNISQWIIFILIIQVIHFLGTWKLYVKAGRKAWEAAIPVYNAIVLMQIIRRPKWWVILLFIPIINLLMFPVIWVETIRSYGKNSLLDTWLVILTLGFYIYYVNYALDVKYIEDRSLHPTTGLGEWVSSIVFAIVAATFVHTYFIQPYVIPTSSLEKTLLVGDFLFVSKFNYGARTPMTTVAAPMVHDTLPVLGLKSYLNKPQLPYFRLPGFQRIKRNDIVVFSWPADTVRQFFVREKGVKKPIDKKSNYVKRCVGISGDTISVVDGYVHINGKKTVLPDRAKPMFFHVVTTKAPLDNTVLNILGRKNFTGYTTRIPKEVLQKNNVPELMKKGTNLDEIKQDSSYVYYTGNFGSEKIKNYLKAEDVRTMNLFNLTEAEAKKIEKLSAVVSVKKFSYKNPTTKVFPQNANLAGTEDNFGPIYIPKAGATIKLNTKNLPIYKKILTEYEGNTLAQAGNQITVNGKVTDTYTFKQDYFWMMGDNRHQSEDSRYWGFVPENHVVGKPIFIWMSIDGINDGFSNWKPRWNRFFTTVGGSGEPVSYLKYFLIALVAYFAFDYFRKKKKKTS